MHTSVSCLSVTGLHCCLLHGVPSGGSKHCWLLSCSSWHVLALWGALGSKSCMAPSKLALSPQTCATGKLTLNTSKLAKRCAAMLCVPDILRAVNNAVACYSLVAKTQCKNAYW